MADRDDILAQYYGDARPRAELRSYEFPWYQRLGHSITDLLYGPEATARDNAFVQKFTGPENPFNIPARISHGTDTALQGWRSRDPAMMGVGALEAGTAAILSGVAIARGANRAGQYLKAWDLERRFPDETAILEQYRAPPKALRDYRVDPGKVGLRSANDPLNPRPGHSMPRGIDPDSVDGAKYLAALDAQRIARWEEGWRNEALWRQRLAERGFPFEESALPGLARVRADLIKRHGWSSDPTAKGTDPVDTFMGAHGAAPWWFDPISGKKLNTDELGRVLEASHPFSAGWRDFEALKVPDWHPRSFRPKPAPPHWKE